jgi:NADH-quinone oxidoreductase subunit H
LIQWRVGPPWYQPWIDVIKLAGKEVLVPEDANSTVFLLAPVVAFACAALVATLLWHVLLGRGTYVGDLIVVLYLTVIPSLALILGSSASASPHAAVGASREMKLILSYELPLAFAMVVAIIKLMAAGHPAEDVLRLAALAEGKPIWSISGFIAFLVALLCIQAKLNQVPFDIA